MGFDRKGFDREVGIRLQLARKRRKMTQGELAGQVGITRATYANLEAGRQRIPIDVVWRVAVTLGVPISSLAPEPVFTSRIVTDQQTSEASGGERSTLQPFPGSLPFLETVTVDD